MEKKKFIHFCDVTLRDGSYGIMHQYTKEQVVQITKGLSQAGVKLIEVGHGDGVGGSTITYGRSLLSEEEMFRTAAENKGDAELMLVCIPGIGTMEEVTKAHANGVQWARVAVHATKSDVTEQHIKQCKNIGMNVAAMLSTCHVLNLEETVMHAKRLESYGADVIYLADSCGTMFPEEVKERFTLLKEHVQVPLGFHGHNNLTMAIANSLAAAEAGADYIDGACRGMGAGAGNAQSEVLIGCLKRKQYETGVDFYQLMDLAEEVVEPVLQRPQVVRNMALVIGYVGTYGSFLLHAEKAGKKYGLDPRTIIEELGRRKMVMGQEDMIVDVAYALAQEKEQKERAAQKE